MSILRSIPSAAAAAFLLLLFSLSGCERGGKAEEAAGQGVSREKPAASAVSGSTVVNSQSSAEPAAREAEAELEKRLRRWEGELEGGENAGSVREAVLELAKTRWRELADALNGMKHAQLRAITASALAFQAGELDVKTGAELLRKLQPHQSNFNGSLLQCIDKWTRDADAAAVWETLRTVKAQELSPDNGINPLAVFAESRINRDPDTVFEVIQNAPPEFRGETADAYRSAARRVFQRNRPDVHDRLIQTALEGDTSALGALTTIAVQMSLIDPEAYAPKLEALRGEPAIYDHLTFGFIQNVARVDGPSAEAWAATIHDPELRKAAAKTVAELRTRHRS